MGILYIVPTPIGNLKDITIRSLEVLKSVDTIYCEDTRHSKILMNEYDIRASLKSFHKFNERSRIDEIIALLDEKDIAIISDAGTPGISDPCSLLVEEARSLNKKIITLPGATAFVPALVSSGLDTSRFLFVGFLSQKKGERLRTLEDLKEVKSTIIFYESPHHINETLKDMLDVFGNRNISIAREISKIYEEHISTDIKTAVDMDFRGELVIVVEGAKEIKKDFRLHVDHFRSMGMSNKDILKEVLKLDREFKRNEVYQYLVENKHE